MRNKMKKQFFLLCALSAMLCAMEAFPMPSQKDIAETQEIVGELMKEHIAANKKGKKTLKAVGDTAMERSKDARCEAAKYVLLKSALTYYGRGKAYYKAADAFEELMMVP